jgi:hypothetical protein
MSMPRAVAVTRGNGQIGGQIVRCRLSHDRSKALTSLLPTDLVLLQAIAVRRRGAASFD